MRTLVVACVALVCSALVTATTGCRRPPVRTRFGSRGDVLMSDGPEVVQRPGRGVGDQAAADSTSARYFQRSTIPIGKTLTVGPGGYAQVKLLGVAADGRSAAFEADHLVDRRRGSVTVGESFFVFTPIFGDTGAVLEGVTSTGATVLFRWSQPVGSPVPPGASLEPAGQSPKVP